MSGALRTFFDRISRGFCAPTLLCRPWIYGVSDGTAGANREPLYLWGYRGGLAVTPATTTAGTDAVAFHGYAYPSADQTIKVKSSSVNDKPASTGAHTVRVWWLDVNNVESYVDINLNGTTVVASAVVTMRRVQGMEVIAAGATGYNEGYLYVYPTDGATVLLRASINRNVVSQRGVRTVPAGKRDAIVRVHFPFCDITNVLQAVVRYRTSPTSPWQTVAQLPEATTVMQNVSVVFDTPLMFEAGTDYQVFVRGNSDAHGACLVGWTEDA